MKTAKKQIKELMLCYNKNSILYVAHRSDLAILKEAVEELRRTWDYHGIITWRDIKEIIGDWDKDKESEK